VSDLLNEVRQAKAQVEQLGKVAETAVEALVAIADFDAFQGGPIAPRETPTTNAMRELARIGLEEVSRSLTAIQFKPIPDFDGVTEPF
jgi:hypothetical protein